MSKHSDGEGALQAFPMVRSSANETECHQERRYTRSVASLLLVVSRNWPEQMNRSEVQGNLAAMLRLATNAKRPSESDDLERTVLLVAGACNQLDWQACHVA